jgi:hypothetical protein
LSAHGLPLLRNLGSSGLILSHCSSRRNVSIPSFSPLLLYIVQTFLSVTSKNL